MRLKFRYKLSTFGDFNRFFKKRYTPQEFPNRIYEESCSVSSEHFIFHPTSMGVIHNDRVKTDTNLLISRNKDVLRNHYFSMKAYFIRFCNDPFLKAYYVNLQKEKNDNYYGFMKFYFSKDEVLRRHEDRLCRENDIPF